ncbi:hypothetical protein AB0C34_17150 [Nocardia sp. NPDC049220]|uniref:hypothetical protein n=1 Tax=Nocardia sp. NPDC049220 TaxID=3155273 RepID=UPI0034037B75
MTDRGKSRDEHVDRWLRVQQEEILQDLTELLDVEAGLQEVVARGALLARDTATP